MKKIGVIGLGAFGYSISLLLAKTYPDLIINAVDLNDEVKNSIREKKHHAFFYTDIHAPDNIVIHDTAESCLKDVEMVLLSVPAQYMRKTLEPIKEFIPKEAILLHVCKALETGSDKRISVVIREELGKTKNPIANISGGMLGVDVAHGRPVAADIGCKDKKALKILEELFKPTTVYVETTADIAGVELGGAFKNVVTISGGIADGLELGTSAKAFFVSKTLREIETLSLKLGAKDKTFHTSSASWMGDLMTTSFGNSRNRYFGELIGRGHSAEEAIKILKEENKHAEGYATLKVVDDLLDKYKIKAPFLKTLYDVVYNKKNPRESFIGLSRQS